MPLSLIQPLVWSSPTPPALRPYSLLLDSAAHTVDPGVDVIVGGKQHDCAVVNRDLRRALPVFNLQVVDLDPLTGFRHTVNISRREEIVVEYRFDNL